VDEVRLSDDAHGARVLTMSSGREKTFEFQVTNLEDPIALRLVNSESESQLAAFVGRFGFPARYAASKDSFSLNVLEAIRDDLEELLAMSTHDPRVWVSLANDLLQHTALHPTFEFSEGEGKQRMVFRPSTLEDVLYMECALALEVGAVLARCEHCNKAFLTGALTGRRSHAKYCSDRCRVAAMRARKAAKETWKEGF
jgi:hypothetical protein